MSPHPMIGLVATLSVADPAGCDLCGDARAALGLASGVVSAGQVDAIARAAAPLEPDTRASLLEASASLVDAASVSTVEWFERHVRELARRLDADDGLRQAERVRQARFCAAGPTARPVSATPTSPSTPKPTPASR
jgi:hypothetical protein